MHVRIVQLQERIPDSKSTTYQLAPTSVVSWKSMSKPETIVDSYNTC